MREQKVLLAFQEASSIRCCSFGRYRRNLDQAGTIYFVGSSSMTPSTSSLASRGRAPSTIASHLCRAETFSGGYLPYHEDRRRQNGEEAAVGSGRTVCTTAPPRIGGGQRVDKWVSVVAVDNAASLTSGRLHRGRVRDGCDQSAPGLQDPQVPAERGGQPSTSLSRLSWRPRRTPSVSRSTSAHRGGVSLEDDEVLTRRSR